MTFDRISDITDSGDLVTNPICVTLLNNLGTNPDTSPTISWELVWEFNVGGKCGNTLFAFQLFLIKIDVHQ